MEKWVGGGGGGQLSQGDCWRSRTKEFAELQLREGVGAETDHVPPAKWHFSTVGRIKMTHMEVCLKEFSRWGMRGRRGVLAPINRLQKPDGFFLLLSSSDSEDQRWARSRRFSQLGVDVLHNCLFSLLHNAAVSEGKIRLCNVLLVDDPRPIFTHGHNAHILTSWLNRTRASLTGNMFMSLWGSVSEACRTSELYNIHLEEQIGSIWIHMNTESGKDLRSCSTAGMLSRPSSHGSVHPWKNWLLFVGHQVKIYLLVISLCTLLHWLIHKLINIAALHT